MFNWLFGDDSADADPSQAEEWIEAGDSETADAAPADAGDDWVEPSADDAKAATIVDWAQRLMITKGYGWSKAVDAARDMYGD